MSVPNKMSPPARTHAATYILIAAAIMLLAAFPFRDTFCGGFFTHVSSAALIGGLADWYAVTALFRRPLGIAFKTAIIPNSKVRIAEMARHMVEHEILTVPNMYAVLKHHPILGSTLDYLHTGKGFQAAERVFGQMLTTFLYTVDIQTLVNAFSSKGGQAVEKIDLAPIMSKAIKIGLRGESGKDFLDFMILYLEKIIRSDMMGQAIGEIYEASLLQYAKRNIFLGWAIKTALKVEVLRPPYVAGILQKKGLSLLTEAKADNSVQREQALRYLWKKTEQIQFNDDWHKRIDSYKNRMYQSLVTRPDTGEAWQRYIRDPERQRRICNWVAAYVIRKLESWRESPDRIEQLNHTLLTFLSQELKKLQEWFGKTAEQEILKYDGTYLAEQLENSVWYDLQVIRINGSLVGALLGAVIYLIMYAVKGGA